MIGQEIVGAVDENFGHSVSLSADGVVLAGGAYFGGPSSRYRFNETSQLWIPQWMEYPLNLGGSVGKLCFLATDIQLLQVIRCQRLERFKGVSQRISFRWCYIEPKGIHHIG
jgi:hypothetical protein